MRVLAKVLGSDERIDSWRDICLPLSYVDETFAGWGTDEECIIRILGHRNAAQRKLIRETYEAAYEKDLLQDLAGEISGDFQVRFVFSL